MNVGIWPVYKNKCWAWWWHHWTLDISFNSGYYKAPTWQPLRCSWSINVWKSSWIGLVTRMLRFLPFTYKLSLPYSPNFRAWWSRFLGKDLFISYLNLSNEPFLDISEVRMGHLMRLLTIPSSNYAQIIVL